MSVKERIKQLETLIDSYNLSPTDAVLISSIFALRDATAWVGAKMEAFTAIGAEVKPVLKSNVVFRAYDITRSIHFYNTSDELDALLAQAIVEGTPFPDGTASPETHPIFKALTVVATCCPENLEIKVSINPK